MPNKVQNDCWNKPQSGTPQIFHTLDQKAPLLNMHMYTIYDIDDLHTATNE